MDTIDFNEAYKAEPFFELSPDLLCIAGFDGYFKRVNPAVSKTLGYSNEELLSKPIDEFIHPEDLNVTSKYRSNIQKGVPLTFFENRYVTKEGEIVWLAWTSMPLNGEQLVYAIAKNITHKKELEEERTGLINQLSSINHELKQLSYTTSHDLRAPVNNFLSIIGFLNTTQKQDEETLQFYELLKLSSENMKETLDKHLDALSEKSRLRISLGTVNLPTTLSRVIKPIGTLISSTNTRFSLDFSAFETVSFNAAYMDSIFLNLISNSIKYRNPDFSPVISIKTQKSGNAKQLIFTDNGLGFDMEKVQDKIFGLNQKFHNHTDSKGVGLYLVYNHITSLGGQIQVASEINVGTTFTITFKD